MCRCDLSARMVASASLPVSCGGDGSAGVPAGLAQGRTGTKTGALIKKNRHGGRRYQHS